MQVARPPDGFRIVVLPEVVEYIRAEAQENFRVEQFWKDILERLKITALREGHKIPSDGAPKFSFLANGAVDFNIPSIQVVYECFGDTLTVLNALVWAEQDYEDSSY